ncbi:S8 family serine peptidase [Pelagicoccus sp. SDUM812002]|uniref:S8 family serine peptidase n=1 Tax=Pelagicoccus sp. SDUM812002 TaxID=3041266 RepID=UPI00280ED909|nr:S8 family serine peptidase [Pelagicoccus sp. SDUM812002]MDQ8186790.1 S8 family serine peptidase [Pelagicoccus sp. SDUM812002]
MGPTFDGRLGVDVAAPGEFLITVYAPDSHWATFGFNKVQDGNGHYGKANAVSAAAPIVTGIVALMLQANPELDQLQIREILRSTARSDAFTGDVPNAVWGYGKVDAYEAVMAALLTNAGTIHASIVVSGEVPLLSFASTAGLTYKIEYKDEVDDPAWSLLEDGLVGTGSEIEYFDESFGDSARRFYRVGID